jgi:hypothetical protein
MPSARDALYLQPKHAAVLLKQSSLFSENKLLQFQFDQGTDG